MPIRALSVPLALVAALAMPAAAQDVVVQADGATVPVETAPDPFFYGSLEPRGESTGFAEPWYVRDGADQPYDTDPRDSLILPQPQPVFSFGLR